MNINIAEKLIKVSYVQLAEASEQLKQKPHTRHGEALPEECRKTTPPPLPAREHVREGHKHPPARSLLKRMGVREI